MHSHSRVYLPISHIVDSIGGCEGLREHLKKVEDIMHTGAQHTSSVLIHAGGGGEPSEAGLCSTHNSIGSSANPAPSISVCEK